MIEEDVNTDRNPVPASTVEDPMTGQRLTFLVTVEEFDGEYVFVETGLPAPLAGPAHALPPLLRRKVRGRGG